MDRTLKSQIQGELQESSILKALEVISEKSYQEKLVS